MKKSSTILQVNNLTKIYDKTRVVDNLSLSIQQGEIFGLLGPNGAGKTTTISMICGILTPDGGSVSVDKAKIGMCPQNIILWGKLTCMEQLIFMGEMYGMSHKDARKQGEKLLEELFLIEKKDKPSDTLSGGMQRRLNLAMALIHDPEIVILDEPEAGLDPQSRVLVRDFIRELTGEKTVILTTHNMDEADRLAQRIAIIDHGKLLITDTPMNLKNSVGMGDVLEFTLSREKGTFDLEQLKSELPGLKLNYGAQRLTVRGEGLLEEIHKIRDLLNNKGIQYEEMRIRETTLEDVFIKLTGRGLRE